MTKRLLLLMPILFFKSMLMAQTPDTVLKHSPVRTLTDKQYTAYLNGTDLYNMNYVAELNHYPMPDLVLKYKKDLDLSPVQITGLTAEVKTLALKKKEAGLSMIRNERVLDSLFRTKKVDDGMIAFYGNRYGLYQGEYRIAVLNACYKTEKLLTSRQVKLFESLNKKN